MGKGPVGLGTASGAVQHENSTGAKLLAGKGHQAGVLPFGKQQQLSALGDLSHLNRAGTCASQKRQHAQHQEQHTKREGGAKVFADFPHTLLLPSVGIALIYSVLESILWPVPDPR